MSTNKLLYIFVLLFFSISQTVAMSSLLGNKFTYAANTSLSFQELFDSYIAKINKNPIGYSLIEKLKKSVKELKDNCPTIEIKNISGSEGNTEFRHGLTSNQWDKY